MSSADQPRASGRLSGPLAQYVIVTASYWAFTLTDGALRMLVVLFFHNLGFNPLQIALLFLLYELFGVVTNLLGGWVATRIGLNMTMHAGMALQILALVMLMVDPQWLTLLYVMLAQALSGIAKDLNKMSAKTSIKLLVPDASDGRLYRWVARLTGSKNALKGVGFFLGGALLAGLGFQGALLTLALMLAMVLTVSFLLLERRLGITTFKPKFNQLLSQSQAINRLSAARFFLFASRDVWFVVALPVYLQLQLGWDYVAVGSMMASWVIGYGLVQALAPRITGQRPDGGTAYTWALLLSLLPLGIAGALVAGLPAELVLIGGLLLFAVVFAINSSVHSYLIVSYARDEGASMDVGFYYMANAAGRLVGTLLSGLVYYFYGLEMCLLVAAVMLAASFLIAYKLPRGRR